MLSPQQRRARIHQGRRAPRWRPIGGPPMRLPVACRCGWSGDASRLLVPAERLRTLFARCPRCLSGQWEYTAPCVSQHPDGDPGSSA